jgi:hypothetical protein
MDFHSVAVFAAQSFLEKGMGKSSSEYEISGLVDRRRDA